MSAREGAPEPAVEPVRTGWGPAGDQPVPPSTVPETVLPYDPVVARRAHRLAWIYLLVATGLVPWIVYLALTLPRRNLERHYRLSWVGFDVILVVALAMTASMAFRVDARVQYPAMAAATLLVVDAWFDVTTSSSRSAVTVAIVLALGAELPAAIFSLVLARRVSRRVLEFAHLETIRRVEAQQGLVDRDQDG